jgi:cytochrome c biogenesis protein CcmG/thiol:disulfide interchange protein DsbE
MIPATRSANFGGAARYTSEEVWKAETMKNRSQWIAVGIVLGMLAFGGIAAWLLTPEITRIEPGAKAPDASLVDVATGDTVSVRDFRGQVVLLNLWATWCPPCLEEMPSMERLYQELGPEGLKIIAISIDQIDRNAVHRWTEERGLTFTILQDRSGKIQQTYQTTGTPESFVLDKDGVIVKKVIGAIAWDHPGQKALFRRLLATD